MGTISAVLAAAVSSGAGRGHAAQLILAGELAAELGELGDEVLADLGHGVLGGDGTVGLNADEELGHVRVSDCFGERVLAIASRGRETGAEGLLLYPAIITWGCILRCSETRLPMVWSSFLIRKSEQLDMPGCQCQSPLSTRGGKWA